MGQFEVEDFTIEGFSSKRRAEKAKPSSADSRSRRKAAPDFIFAPLAWRLERPADNAALSVRQKVKPDFLPG
jgi:hypothetical protein